MYFYLVIIGIIIFLIILLPFKNWLEIKSVQDKDRKWSDWLKEKPSLEEYLTQNNQEKNKIFCNYCGFDRQLPSLEMVISSRPKFGFISNSFNKYSYFKTYICSRCGTHLYRERREE